MRPEYLGEYISCETRSQYLVRPEFGWMDMSHIHLALMQPSHGPTAFHPGTTRQDSLIPGSQSTTINHTEMKPLSHRSGSWNGPTHYWRVFCRAQEQDVLFLGPGLVPTSAWVSPHIRKLKFQASIKNEMKRNHKLMNI